MLILDAVQLLSQGAVHVEPPVADGHLLVEDRPIRAEEGVLDVPDSPLVDTDVEDLAFSFGVGIVASRGLVVTGKRGLRCLRKDGVVVPWNPWDCGF